MDFAEIDVGGGPETGIQLGVSLPRELGAYVNSVYQALFPPPPHKSLGTRLVPGYACIIAC